MINSLIRDFEYKAALSFLDLMQEKKIEYQSLAA